MAEFNGRSFLTVDAKGRLFLPQGYRDILGEDFVISLSDDLKTLAFICKQDWELKSAKLKRIPQTDRKAHKLLRLIYSSTFAPYNSDAQGRVLIPQALRQDYGLTEGSEAALVGAGSTLELWNAERFRDSVMNISEDEADESLDYVYDTYFANTDINEEDAGDE